MNILSRISLATPLGIALTTVLSILTLSADPANPSISGKARLMQGPMIGAVNKNSALIWTRLSGPHEQVVLYGETPDRTSMKRSNSSLARAETDYTIHFRLEGLKPDTTYYYSIEVDGRLHLNPPASFQTAPAEPDSFTVGLGSCAKLQDDPIQNIWSHVRANRPDLFFWLGDNAYIDSLHQHVYYEEYRRMKSLPNLIPLLRSTPQLATWDDHDFGLNDGDRTHPAKKQALKAFKNYWANPSAGIPGTPGIFFQYHYAGVDFFFLDGRYYRDPNLDPDTPTKTHLGNAQLNWLKNNLKSSNAAFKVLISGSGWTQFKGPCGDAWSSYIHERNNLFNFIRDEAITGVFLLSGDTHRGEANVIPRGNEGGYDLVEFVSSPLAQTVSTEIRHAPGEFGLRVPYTRALNFGLLRFDMTSADPVASFELINAAGESVFEPVRLYASKLRNGNSFWEELIDEDATALYLH